MNRQRGLTLVEMLVTAAIVAILAAGILQMFLSVNSANTRAMSRPPVDNDAVSITNRIAKELRNAQICTATSGCQLGSAFSQATLQSATTYNNSSGNTVRFFLDNGAIKKTEGSATTVIVPSGATLSYAYCLSPIGTYNTAADPGTLPFYGAITVNSDLNKIIAVKINVRVLRNGVESAYSTIVRVRNSPNRYPT